MSLFNKKNIDKYRNLYNITEDDMIGEIRRFPIGLVIRMMEEQEAQGNKPNVKVFQDQADSGQEAGGFDWIETEDGQDFWDEVIMGENFELFFEEYPEYK